MALSGSSSSLTNRQPDPSLRKSRHPAGIQARIDQLASKERSNDFQNKIIDPIIETVNYLRNKCVMCMILRKSIWDCHSSDNCPKGIGTNLGDPDYVSFRSRAFKLPNGWCFSCLLHQVWVF